MHVSLPAGLKFMPIKIIKAHFHEYRRMRAVAKILRALPSKRFFIFGMAASTSSTIPSKKIHGNRKLVDDDENTLLVP